MNEKRMTPRLRFDEPRSLLVTDGADDGGEHSSCAHAQAGKLRASAREQQKRGMRRGRVKAGDGRRAETEGTPAQPSISASRPHDGKQPQTHPSSAQTGTGGDKGDLPGAPQAPVRLHFDDEQPPASKGAPGFKPSMGKRIGERQKPPENIPPFAQETPARPAQSGRLLFEKDRPQKPSALRQTASIAVREAFREQENDWDDNAGLDAANAGERAAGMLARSTRNHAIQKRAIRRTYALAKSGRDSAFATSAAQQAVYAPAERAARRLASFVSQMRGKAVFLLLALMLFFMMNCLSSCAPLVEAGLQAVVMGTYPAEEADILAAQNAYAEMERALQDELDNYALYHPDYDEVEIEQMDIWHDPYALIALISAHFDGEAWAIDDAMPFLERLFEQQYELTETAASEQRYQTVDGEQVWFTHTVCKVKLVNKNLSHLPFMVLSRQQVGLYAMYMSTLGNMPELFAGDPHASELKEPTLYDVPEETLDADPQFAALIEEAEKYIGYPYVWGGDSPDTSFDCSGFISWVFTQTGVRNTGRLGATGLYNACEEIQPEEARPGDLIFFTGTLGEGEDGNDGVTHVGLYVGDGMMLHCGNPISYADLSRSYWQEHFYGFGRLY